jgi:hypothetical protein
MYNFTKENSLKFTAVSPRRRSEGNIKVDLNYIGSENWAVVEDVSGSCEMKNVENSDTAIGYVVVGVKIVVKGLHCTNHHL